MAELSRVSVGAQLGTVTQLRDSMAELSRVSVGAQLGAVTQLRDSMAELSRVSVGAQLGTVTQLRDSMAELSRVSVGAQLGAVTQLRDSMAELSRVSVGAQLGTVTQLRDSMAELSRVSVGAQLGTVTQLRDSMAVLNIRTFSALNLNRRSITTRAEHEPRPPLAMVEAEDYVFTRETAHWLMLFDALVKDTGLRRVCRSLLADGYYTLAVQQAFIYINNMVKIKSRRGDKDGADLMQKVFGANDPVLLLNAFQSQSDVAEQRGLHADLRGGNDRHKKTPVAHEHDLEDDPEEALEMLFLANHLVRRLTRSTLA